MRFCVQTRSDDLGTRDHRGAFGGRAQKARGELKPELANRIRDAVLADADSGSFARLHLDPAVHRVAERLLLATDSVHLRTLDALHLALAFSGAATHVLTFDRRMREAALQSGLNVIDL